MVTKTAAYTGKGWRSGMFSYEETCTVDARDGKNIFARSIPELSVVGIYRDGALLFSLRAEDAYRWASDITVLTVGEVATDEQKDQALQRLAMPGAPAPTD